MLAGSTEQASGLTFKQECSSISIRLDPTDSNGHSSEHCRELDPVDLMEPSTRQNTHENQREKNRKVVQLQQISDWVVLSNIVTQ